MFQDSSDTFYEFNEGEFGHFTLLFCRVRQRNVPEVITHVQTIGLLVKLCRCRRRCHRRNSSSCLNSLISSQSYIKASLRVLCGVATVIRFGPHCNIIV